MNRLALIGGGRMGEALVAGLLRSGWAAPADLAVIDTDASRRHAMHDAFPGVTVSGSLVEAEGVVIAVKPPGVAAVCASLVQLATPPARVLSIAAGVTLATLEGSLPTGTAAVRAMPNTPALVGAGASAIAGGSTATAADIEWAGSILGAVGTVTQVPESALNAVTGLSGSGPAYVFLIAEALVDAGVLVGLPRSVAVELASQTLLGSARLLTESGDSAAELRAAVTSPGGTTAAGLRALEEGGVRAAFLAAVVAATNRAAELG